MKGSGWNKHLVLAIPVDVTGDSMTVPCSEAVIQRPVPYRLLVEERPGIKISMMNTGNEERSIFEGDETQVVHVAGSVHIGDREIVQFIGHIGWIEQH